jgi:hypothetical protein
MKKRHTMFIGNGAPHQLHDRLVYEKNELARKKAQLQEQHLYEEAKKTPFRPNISPLRLKSGAQTTRHSNIQGFNNKFDMLYADAATKNKNLKKDKTREEVELEREGHEYTFQPNRERRGEYASTSPTRMSLRSPLLGRGVRQEIRIHVNIGGDRKVILTDDLTPPREAA